MNNNFQDILNEDASKPVDPEMLALYLQGKLDEVQRHAVESAMLQDDFAQEAFEGLSTFENTERLGTVSAEIKKGLQSKLKIKNQRSLTWNTKQNNWFIYAIILIVLLCIIGFVVVLRFQS